MFSCFGKRKIYGCSCWSFMQLTQKLCRLKCSDCGNWFLLLASPVAQTMQMMQIHRLSRTIGQTNAVSWIFGQVRDMWWSTRRSPPRSRRCGSAHSGWQIHSFHRNRMFLNRDSRMKQLAVLWCANAQEANDAINLITYIITSPVLASVKIWRKISFINHNSNFWAELLVF